MVRTLSSRPATRPVARVRHLAHAGHAGRLRLLGHAGRLRLLGHVVQLAAVLVVALGLIATSAATASAVRLAAAATPSGGAISYILPVAGAVVVDRFRAPTSPYAAGNRGIDEVTAPGTPVVAMAAGEVVFAGPVAGSLHLTLRHADGFRSSYSYLAGIAVAVGDQVEQGQAIGVTGSVFHFGVRDGSGTYLDPDLLVGPHHGAHLVPGPDEGGRPLTREPSARSQLGRLEQLERAELSAVVRAGRRAGSGALARAVARGHETLAVSAPVSLAGLAAEVERWHDQQQRCTPAATPVPRPAGRRVAVLVGGLGSSSDHAAIDRVDVGALGYDPADVVRFSYLGGRVPGRPSGGPLDSIAATTYGPLDTEVDLHRSADRLVDLIDAVSRAAPGLPIDVLAHSQGGLVVRLALARLAAERPQTLGTVVTLGAPHRGADLATALTAVDPRSPRGQGLALAARAWGVDLDLGGSSIEQLGETSPVIAELDRPVPDGVRLLSIGASGDLTVPDVRTVVAGADHTTVHLGGPHAHDRLPADPATTREIGLALAGAPPTCIDPIRGLGDLVVSHAIGLGEDALGSALAAGAGP